MLPGSVLWNVSYSWLSVSSSALAAPCTAAASPLLHSSSTVGSSGPSAAVTL